MRDRADDFRAADCLVLGVSFDTPADNKTFAETQNFGFALLSDVDRLVGEAYEVVRATDDQYESFPLRISYLIDPGGIIRNSYTVTDVAAHAEHVLHDLVTLRKAS